MCTRRPMKIKSLARPKSEHNKQLQKAYRCQDILAQAVSPDAYILLSDPFLTPWTLIVPSPYMVMTLIPLVSSMGRMRSVPPLN